jgi:hypothetical protein
MTVFASTPPSARAGGAKATGKETENTKAAARGSSALSARGATGRSTACSNGPGGGSAYVGIVLVFTGFYLRFLKSP